MFFILAREGPCPGLGRVHPALFLFIKVCCRCSPFWGVRSIPPVQPPQKFVAQGGGKVCVEHAHQPQFEICFVEHQFGAAVQGVDAGVQGGQVGVFAGFNAQGDGVCVGDDERTHGEVVRRNGGDDEVVGPGNEDGPAAGEVVAGGAGGGGDDQAVCPVGIEEGVVEVDVDGDHAGGALAGDGHFVEGEVGVQRHATAAGFRLEHVAFFHGVFAAEHRFRGGSGFGAGNGGQEAQASGVDAQEGDAAAGYQGAGVQDGAVAAQANDQGGVQGLEFVGGFESGVVPASVPVGVGPILQAAVEVHGLACARKDVEHFCYVGKGFFREPTAVEGKHGAKVQPSLQVEVVVEVVQGVLGLAVRVCGWKRLHHGPAVATRCFCGFGGVRRINTHHSTRAVSGFCVGS